MDRNSGEFAVIVKQGDTGNLKNHTYKLNELTMYPHRVLILGLDNYATSILDITPLPNRFGNDDYVIWINCVTYDEIYTGSIEQLDLTSTGLNGIVDGITFTAANSRDFLIWAFENNANNGFTGFALTHKPYSTYTGPAAAAKGATVSFTGLTNAYQFTVGSRVAIRNTVGTAPLYEWNWGTVNSIVSSTSINVTMDNNAAYGVALTAATGGNILQWDKFRPWVVTSTSQTLYTENYRLIGELTTDASGNIRTAYRVDSPWRPEVFSQIYTNTTATLSGTLATISAARYIPLWSKKIDALLVIRNSTANIVYEIRCLVHNGRAGILNNSLGAGLVLRTCATMSNNAYASVDAWIASTTTNLEFSIYID